MPYGYSIPHIGNITGSVLPADVFYKYLKMKGEDVIYICGSDEHGTAMELAALRNNTQVEQFSNEMHDKIKKVFSDFEFTFTHYGRTHTEQNRDITYSIFNGLKENGYITEIESEQPYCKIDQRFLSDRFIEGKCPHCGAYAARGDQCDNCGRLLTPKEIIDPRCRICGKNEIVFLKTSNLAIDYKKLEPKILAFVKENEKNNWSRNSVNKTLSYIEEGLRPVEITRDIKWGFQVPMPEYKDKVFYVWFDAPIGYIGITKEWDGAKWTSYWFSKETKLYQFMGKDNIQFHTIHWPGMLIGSKLGFVTPYCIRASEFIVDKQGEKLSKSRGIGIAIDQALKMFPADYWRFALIYIYPETSDSEFSPEIFQEIINNVLNDKIGNFVHRVLTIAGDNKELVKGEIKVDDSNSGRINGVIKRYEQYFDKVELREALRTLVEIADMGNSIMSTEEPWALAKNNQGKFSEITNTLLAIVYDVGVLSYPFIPDASKKILKHFGISDQPKLEMLKSEIKIDLSKKTVPLFKKVDKKDFPAT